MSLTIYTVELTKARIDFVEDFSSQQTETAVSNNNKCITKSRPTKFYSTLCHTAKRTQRYNLIRSTQNNSTSVEQNCQPLAQNKFNNCPPTQKSNGPPPVAKQNHLRSSRHSNRFKLPHNDNDHHNNNSRYASALYRKQNHVT